MIKSDRRLRMTPNSLSAPSFHCCCLGHSSRIDDSSLIISFELLTLLFEYSWFRQSPIVGHSPLFQILTMFLAVEKKDIQVTYCGSPGVGIASAIIRTRHNAFPRETCEVSYFDQISYYFTCNDICFTVYTNAVRDVDSWDAKSDEHFANSEVLAFVFAVDDQKSFDTLRDSIIPHMRALRPDQPVALIGTKSDRRAECDSCVNLESAKALAKQIGASYEECSAKSGENIDAFSRLAIHAKYPPHRCAIM